jgi:hypothetical protein
MNKMTRPGTLLILSLGAVFCFVIVLNLLSSRVAVIENNRIQGLEADAYFYTEVGDLEDFLDEVNGKYR